MRRQSNELAIRILQFFDLQYSHLKFLVFEKLCRYVLAIL